MAEHFVSRGFVGKRREGAGAADRVPPGQHEVKDFPVLSAGPTPRVNLDRWSFSIEGLVRKADNLRRHMDMVLGRHPELQQRVFAELGRGIKRTAAALPAPAKVATAAGQR